MVEKMKAMPEKFFLIVPEPEFVNVSFWYVPTRLRSMPQ
jgi:glutamate decarboxylase